MTPFSKLHRELEARFPEAVVEMEVTDRPDGWNLLHLWVEDFVVGLQWTSSGGFGLSSWVARAEDPTDLFDPPDEWYSKGDAAFHRIVSLVVDRKATRPCIGTLADIRTSRGVSQESLSDQLNVRQGTYSKLERRDDVKVSSLRKVIESMGGRLIIQAVFPDTREVREIRFDRSLIEK